MAALLFLVFTYLVAAVPFGLVLSTLYGADQDIRAAGSNNVGATNVARVYGWKMAAPVLLLDLGKGLLPVLLAPLVLPGGGLLWAGLVGAVAWLGHTWSVYLGFQGGKGVATGGGVMLALTPTPTLAATVTWVALLVLTGRSSVASLGATAGLVAYTALLDPVMVPLAVVLAAGVFALHLSNIRRLVRGEEARVLPPVRLGRGVAEDEDVAALLEAPPGGAGDRPALWREGDDV